MLAFADSLIKSIASAVLVAGPFSSAIFVAKLLANCRYSLNTFEVLSSFAFVAKLLIALCKFSA